MSPQYAQSPSAKIARTLVTDVQSFFVGRLNTLSMGYSGLPLSPMHWLREEGVFGGGVRYVAPENGVFNRASVNVSQVQYEADPLRFYSSATALSTIIHPRHPHAPSLHLHISWTELKSGQGSWRLMADLNPSLPHPQDTIDFNVALMEAAGPLYEFGQVQGDRYFQIPALGRKRGVAHFYLEGYATTDAHADQEFARNFGMTVCAKYCEILERALSRGQSVTEEDRMVQLAYHTTYFLQVLTLDRGTTSGILVHKDNDLGTLGSLPSAIDRDLLKSWLPFLPDCQKILVSMILEVFPKSRMAYVGDVEKIEIAKVLRAFHSANPEARDFLARGHTLPPTEAGHRPSHEDHTVKAYG